MSHALVLGLGGCVDFEVAWSPELLAELAAEHAIAIGDLDSAVQVTDERSLLVSILSFVREGVGGERFLASSQLAVEFASRFDYQITLGGTCVRAAQAIARLGVPSLVHLVSIDDNVRRLLDPRVAYLCSAARDTLDPHLIIQFPGDAAIALIDGEVHATHPNRIIYVNDPPNRDLPLSPELPDALTGARAFLPSGFNVMRDPELLRERLRFLQLAMTRLPDDAVVFYEDAGFHDNALRDIVSAEFRGRVDIHSVNEDELQSYVGRRLDLLDAEAVAGALTEFRPLAIASTIVVHTRVWTLAFGERAAGLSRAIAGGIDLASTRYCHGDHFTRHDLDAVRRLPRQPRGIGFAAEISRLLGDEVLCVPARTLDVEHPTSIGLGDTFVGGFLAALVAEFPQ